MLNFCILDKITSKFCDSLGMCFFLISNLLQQLFKSILNWYWYNLIILLVLTNSLKKNNQQKFFLMMQHNTCAYLVCWKLKIYNYFSKFPTVIKLYWNQKALIKIATDYVFIYNILLYKTALLSFSNGVKSATKRLECVSKANLLHHSNV